MAKKRQRKKVYKPPPPKLETQFNCPECGRKKVVEVHFDKRENKGHLRCRACGEEYESKLKRASEPIDIYYNLINHRDIEIERNNKKNNEEGGDEIEEGENEEIEQQENEIDNEEQEQEQEQYKDKGDYEDDDNDGDYNEEEGSDY